MKIDKSITHNFIGVYVVVMCLLVTVIYTWAYPVGIYNVDVGGNQIPGTYHILGYLPITIWDTLRSLVNSSIDALPIVLFIISLSAFAKIMRDVGTLQYFMDMITSSITRAPITTFLCIIFITSILSSGIGLWEEYLAILPLLALAIEKAKYSSIYALVCIVCGVTAGGIGAITNPFATGIASMALDISISSGIYPRIYLYIACVAVTMLYIIGLLWINKLSQLNMSDNSIEETPLESFSVSTWVHYINVCVCIITLSSLLFLLFPWTHLGLDEVVLWLDKMLIHRIGIILPPLNSWDLIDCSILMSIFAGLVALVSGIGIGGYLDYISLTIYELMDVILVLICGMSFKKTLITSNVMWSLIHVFETMLAGQELFLVILFSLLILIAFSMVIPSTSILATTVLPMLGHIIQFLGVEKSLLVTLLQVSTSIGAAISPTSVILISMLHITNVSYYTWCIVALPLLSIYLILSVTILYWYY